MAGTIATVRGLSRTTPGEFDAPGVSDDAITSALAEAALHLNASIAADRYDMLHSLLAAHLLVDGARGATASSIKGPVVAESLGPASRTYAQSLVKVQDDVLNLNGTTYGRRFLALSKRQLTTPLGLFDFSGS